MGQIMGQITDKAGSWARIRRSLVKRTNGFFHFVRPAQVERIKNDLQLVHAVGAENVRRHERPCRDELHCEGGGMNAEVAGDVDIAADRSLCIGCFVTVKAAEHGAARAFRFDAAKIFAGKRALGDRRVGEKAHLFFHGDFGESVFECAIDEAIGVLDGDDARQGPLLSLAEEAHDAIRGFV